MLITLTDSVTGRSFREDDSNIWYFFANGIEATVYVYLNGAELSPINVTESVSAVAALSPKFYNVTNVQPSIQPSQITASVTYSGGSGTWVAGDRVAINGVYAGLLSADSGTVFTIQQFCAPIPASGTITISNLTTGGTATYVSATYSYSESSTVYLNEAWTSEVTYGGVGAVNQIQYYNPVSADMDVWFVSDTLASITTKVNGGGYGLLGASQTWTGVNTFDNLKITKGTVTQATSITTGVTVNAGAGVITTVSATTAAGSTSEFTVTNSFVSASSVVIAQIVDYAGTYGTNGLPVVSVDSVASGSFKIDISNVAPTNALSGVLKIAFIIV